MYAIKRDANSILSCFLFFGMLVLFDRFYYFVVLVKVMWQTIKIYDLLYFVKNTFCNLLKLHHLIKSTNEKVILEK